MVVAVFSITPGSIKHSIWLISESQSKILDSNPESLRIRT